MTLWWAYAALTSLTLGVGLYVWNIRRDPGPLEQTNIIAWLLIAMTPGLVLYSVFPESQTQTEVELGAVAISATGAVALFLAIWIYGVRSSRHAAERDLDEARKSLRECEEESREQEKLKPIRSYNRYRYPLKQDPTRFVGIAAGDLSNVRDIHLWTNSENTHMRMSRFNERSVSAAIRYLGAKVDEFRDVQKDTIADELRDQMAKGKKQTVPPHTVLVTGPGRLSKKGVKRILHVASVEGQAGQGFTPVANIHHCVRQVLETANSPMLAELKARSVLLPLFGTGQAGGDVKKMIREFIEEAIDFMKHKEIGSLREVYFLAYSELDLERCRAVLSVSPDLGTEESVEP